MRKAAQKPQPQEQESSEEESGSEQGEEKAYVVEAIKASRFDTLAGHWRWVVACPTFCLGTSLNSIILSHSYLIKWEDYGDQDMTWEPAAVRAAPGFRLSFPMKLTSPILIA